MLLDPKKLEFYIIGILQKKGPKSARDLYLIFHRSQGKIFLDQRRPSEDELLVTLAEMEGNRRLIYQNGKWVAIGVNPRLGSPLKIQSKLANDQSQNGEEIAYEKPWTMDQPRSKQENSSQIQGPTPINGSVMDQSGSDTEIPYEKPRTKDNGLKNTLNQLDRKIGVAQKIQCPNLTCKIISEYIPKTSDPKRQRRKCPHCGMKKELKYWIPAAPDLLDRMDQSGSGNEKPYEKPWTMDQPRSKQENSSQIQGPTPINGSVMDQSGSGNEKPYEKPWTMDQSQIGKENEGSDPLGDKIIEYLQHGAIASQIAKDLKTSPATIHRKIQLLLFQGILEDKQTYPKTYKIKSMLPVSHDLPLTIQPRLAEIHNPGLYVPIIPIFGRDPKKLWDKECFDATSTVRVGKHWTKYIYDPRTNPELYKDLGDYKIEINKYIAIYTPLEKLTGSTPVEVVEEAKKKIPIDFLVKRGIPLVPEKTYFGQGDIVVETGDPEIDGLGATAIVRLKKGQVEVFKNDDSKKNGHEGLEFTKKAGLNRAQNLVMLGDRLAKLDQIDAALIRIEAKISDPDPRLATIMPTLDRLTDQVAHLVNSFEKILTGSEPVSSKSGVSPIPPKIDYIM